MGGVLGPSQPLLCWLPALALGARFGPSPFIWGVGRGRRVASAPPAALPPISALIPLPRTLSRSMHTLARLSSFAAAAPPIGHPTTTHFCVLAGPASRTSLAHVRFRFPCTTYKPAHPPGPECTTLRAAHAGFADGAAAPRHTVLSVWRRARAPFVCCGGVHLFRPGFAPFPPTHLGGWFGLYPCSALGQL